MTRREKLDVVILSGSFVLLVACALAGATFQMLRTVVDAARR